MKFVTYAEWEGQSPRFGFLKKGFVVDVLRASIWAKNETNRRDFLEIPTSLKRALVNWVNNYPKLKELNRILPDIYLDSYFAIDKAIALNEEKVAFLPPVPNPSTFRDFISFGQPYQTPRTDKHPGRFPRFYFSNPNNLYGHDAEIPYPEGTQELDFELGLAVIIANGGRDIPSEEADLVIGGYTILNDWTARDVEREELKSPAGLAKAKDFATSMGPCLVTPDDLADVWDGNRFNLRATCRVKGELLAEFNISDYSYPVASMIERASLNADLRPGDYLGSGFTGAGCLQALGPENTGGWLKPGDLVDFTIERLGTLTNKLM